MSQRVLFGAVTSLAAVVFAAETEEFATDSYALYKKDAATVLSTSDESTLNVELAPLSEESSSYAALFESEEGRVYSQIISDSSDADSEGTALDGGSEDAAGAVVAALSGGGFAASWIEDGQTVYFQTYDAAGASQMDDAVMVDDYDSEEHYAVSGLSMASLLPSDGDERVLIAFTRSDTANHRHVYAKLVDLEGAFIGGDSDNLIDVAHNASAPSVAALSEDDLIVVAVVDEDEQHIHGFLYNSTGFLFADEDSDHPDSVDSVGPADHHEEHDHEANFEVLSFFFFFFF